MNDLEIAQDYTKKRLKARLYEKDSHRIVYIFCPGCGYEHGLPISGSSHPVWAWNGSLDKPTFTPSLLNLTGSFANPKFKDPEGIQPTRCHVYITDGKIQFLGDCTHKMRGRTMELPEKYK